MLKLYVSKKIIFGILILSIIKPNVSQTIQDDIQLIKSHDNLVDYYEHKPVSFLLPKSSSIIVKYNPISLLLSSAMYFYQGFFSKQIFANCLFKPSCSEMSKKFIRDFGLIKGVALSADRLMRCNRIAAVGVHPIRINPNDKKIHEHTYMFRINNRNR